MSITFFLQKKLILSLRNNDYLLKNYYHVKGEIYEKGRKESRH
jgi:hypothetical protein